MTTNRRHFLRDCGIGVGGMALATLLARDGYGAPAVVNPTAPREPHFEPKATSVIFLFMAGGPSQLELFDHKPELNRYHGQPIPQSFLQGRRFAFMDSFARQPPKLLGVRRQFARHGRRGSWVSDCLPHTAGVVDDLAIVRSMATDVFNHGPAKVFVNTGSPQFGRPSMGAWSLYGLGSESQSLPGFVVLQSGPRGPRGGAALWSSGFLPTTYQGVPFRNAGEPILNLSNPDGSDGPSSTADAGRRPRPELDAIGCDRRPRDRDEDLRLRDGVPHAVERSRTDRPLQRDAADEGSLRRRPGPAVVRQQLPAGPAPRRTGRTLHPALPH